MLYCSFHSVKDWFINCLKYYCRNLAQSPSILGMSNLLAFSVLKRTTNNFWKPLYFRLCFICHITIMALWIKYYCIPNCTWYKISRRLPFLAKDTELMRCATTVQTERPDCRLKVSTYLLCYFRTPKWASLWPTIMQVFILGAQTLVANIPTPVILFLNT